MSKKLNRAAFAAGLLAALAAPVYAQSQDSRPVGMQAVDGDESYPCSEAARIFRREIARTDGDVTPEVQSEAECRQQYFLDEAQR